MMHLRQLRGWLMRLFGLPQRKQREREFAEELESHLAFHIEDNLRAGMSPEEARRRALIKLGGVTKVQELHREQRGLPMLETLLQDLRFGLRMLRKHPGFTLIAVFTLALGIGANTAIFNLVNTALLKTLPVRGPQQLVFFTVAGPDSVGVRFNFPLIEQMAKNNRSFTEVTATSITAEWRMLEPGAGREVEIVQATRVAGNYFSMLGVGAAVGRTLIAADDSAAGPQPVAVISYNYWRRRFALAPDVVGKKIMLDNYPFTIVGVAPEGFFGFEVGDNPDLWFPLRMTPLLPSGNSILTNRNAWVLRMMARLKPEVSRAQANAEMNAILQQHLSEIAPERAAALTPAQRRNYFEREIRLEAGATGYAPLRDTIKRPLLALMMIVGVVLLIACANVASLLLARATHRRKELAVRLALGAGRWRVIRQMLTESLLLAVLSGGLGLMLARWGARLVLTYLPRQTAATLDISFDVRVIGFTLGVSVLAGLLFGGLPALRGTRVDLNAAMNETAGGSANRARLWLHKSLVVAQVALSLCLLIGAGLFVRSLQNLRNLDAGFDRENVLLFELDMGTRYAPAQRVSLLQQLFARLESLPGARAASRAQFSLLSGSTTTMRVARDGQAQRPGDDLVCHELWVGPKFFTTMGIPLLQGRDFNALELQPLPPDSPPNTSLAAVINQTMARELFGDANPVGQHFRLFEGPHKGLPIEVIGLAKDAKYASLREQTPRTFYLSFFQAPSDGGGTYMLRTQDVAASAAAIQGVVRELDPQVRMLNLHTMDDVIAESLMQERLVAKLGGFFSLAALLLACLGLYGVMSYATASRTQELGVRMALGANASDVVRLVLREAMWLVGIGIGIGVLAALATTRYATSLLYGVTPTDPLTIVAAMLLMLGVAACAGYWPARRAARVDPLVALRHD